MSWMVSHSEDVCGGGKCRKWQMSPFRILFHFFSPSFPILLLFSCLLFLYFSSSHRLLFCDGCTFPKRVYSHFRFGKEGCIALLGSIKRVYSQFRLGAPRCIAISGQVSGIGIPTHSRHISRCFRHISDTFPTPFHTNPDTFPTLFSLTIRATNDSCTFPNSVHRIQPFFDAEAFKGLQSV